MSQRCSNETEKEGRLARELVEGGAEMAGGAIGGALGLIAGPPGAIAGAAGGVVVTRVLKSVGAAFAQRWLDPRQRIRVGAAIAFAAERIDNRLASGDVPREDGFFEEDAGHRSAAEELLESVLRRAADAYEERKVPYIGTLYASFVFRSDIEAPYAHLLIDLAGRLTYRQLVLLAVFHEPARWFPEPPPPAMGPGALPVSNQPPPVVDIPLSAEIAQLVALGLTGVEERPLPGNRPPRVMAPSEMWGGGGDVVGGAGLDRVRLTDLAWTLHEAMGLDAIPLSEREELANRSR